jgi:hypothetical protein
MKFSRSLIPRGRPGFAVVLCACLVLGACAKPEKKKPTNGMPDFSQNVGNPDTFGTGGTSGAKSGTSGSR